MSGKRSVGEGAPTYGLPIEIGPHIDDIRSPRSNGYDELQELLILALQGLKPEPTWPAMYHHELCQSGHSCESSRPSLLITRLRPVYRRAAPVVPVPGTPPVDPELPQAASEKLPAVNHPPPASARG